MTDLTAKVLITRLEHALRVMDEMTPHERRKHFNMAFWGNKTDCGTVGCLAGHCGLDPWFRRRGFRLQFDRTGEGYFEMNAPSPEEFFGQEITNQIFFTQGGYGDTKKLVKKAIRNLKVRGEVGELGGDRG